MTDAVVAYIPVLHEGYLRFIRKHASDRPLFVVGSSLYEDYRPLAKDIRRLDAPHVAAAIAAWRITPSVTVLEAGNVAELAASAESLTLPAEDVSYRLVEQCFSRCAVFYDTVFLRWDKTRTGQLRQPAPDRVVGEQEVIADLRAKALAQAESSADWWRQVGAAIRFADGHVATASNEHRPHALSAYAVGDPRSNFFKGVQLELSTAMHAEARLIAEAARDGRPTPDSVMYVTDFPCPPCAKLIATAGVTRLYFRSGYAVLDGENTLSDAGVEVLHVA